MLSTALALLELCLMLVFIYIWYIYACHLLLACFWAFHGYSAEQCRQLVGEDSSSKSGKFTWINCFDMGSGTLACAAKEGAKLYVYNLRAAHVESTRRNIKRRLQWWKLSQRLLEDYEGSIDLNMLYFLSDSQCSWTCFTEKHALYGCLDSRIRFDIWILQTCIPIYKLNLLEIQNSWSWHGLILVYFFSTEW